MTIGPEYHHDPYAFIDGKSVGPSFETTHPREVNEIAREDLFGHNNKIARGAIAVVQHEVFSPVEQPKAVAGQHAGEYSEVYDRDPRNPPQGRRVLGDQ